MIITVDFQEDLKHRTKAQLMDEAVNVIEAKLDAAIAEIKELEDLARKAYDTAVARVVAGIYTVEDLDILRERATTTTEKKKKPKKVVTMKQPEGPELSVLSSSELFELLELLVN